MFVKPSGGIPGTVMVQPAGAPSCKKEKKNNRTHGTQLYTVDTESKTDSWLSWAKRALAGSLGALQLVEFFLELSGLGPLLL
jgi:SRSO17 transposase